MRRNCCIEERDGDCVNRVAEARPSHRNLNYHCRKVQCFMGRSSTLPEMIANWGQNAKDTFSHLASCLATVSLNPSLKV